MRALWFLFCVHVCVCYKITILLILYIFYPVGSSACPSLNTEISELTAISKCYNKIIKFFS